MVQVAAQVTDSHALISFMRSGTTERTPKFEIANVELLFAYRDLFTLASIDVAVTETDSVTHESELTDAGLQMVRGFPQWSPDDQRMAYVGAWIKIFDTEPMAGPVAGSVELTGSLLHGSRMSMGMMFRLRPSDVLARANLFTEYLFMCECGGQDVMGKVLKLVSFRSSVLIPFDHHRGVAGKIAIMVPLSGIIDLSR